MLSNNTVILLCKINKKIMADSTDDKNIGVFTLINLRGGGICHV